MRPVKLLTGKKSIKGRILRKWQGVQFTIGVKRSDFFFWNLLKPVRNPLEGAPKDFRGVPRVTLIH